MDLTKKGMGTSGYCLSCGGKMAEHGCVQCSSGAFKPNKIGKEMKHGGGRRKDSDGDNDHD